MKIYFLSSQPCSLFFNGLHFGVTDLFERFAEISLKDNLFVEFVPQNAQPIRFFLTENIRFAPPESCDVYLLPQAIAIYAHDFPPVDCTLKMIAQGRFDDCLVSVFQQGRIHLSIQTPENYFISTLPPSFCDCELAFHANLFFISTKNHLAIYTKSGKQVFLEKILDYSIEENTLNATLPLSDSRQRHAKCSYALTEEGCFQTSFSVQENPIANDDLSPNQQGYTPDLLAYTFFESILLHLDYTKYLDEELLPNAEQLPSFLGDFQEVLLHEDANTCGVVRRLTNRLFSVDYYAVELKNGKITDVHPKTPPMQHTANTEKAP